ncbi:HK97 family phage prohead protease [Methylovulum psychrotolerans]|uniref:HK97 family phage prohead protease n=1 Tax=Methylovulum psychrotolerans TaxID=1704499 RepID=UPI001BFF5050|nr:HK97 family phage prohead protease [Methylovulum psychrotolerans]
MRFSDNEDVQPIYNNVKKGILRNISVGYVINTLKESPETRDGLTVYIATDWTPMEISIVPIPADIGAQIRSADQRYPVTIINQETKPMEIPDGEENRGGNADAPKQHPDVDAIRAQAAKDERVRVSEIRAFAQQARVDTAFVDDLIERGIPTHDARAAIIKKWSDAVNAETTRSDGSVNIDERDKFVAMGVNAILGRGGYEKMDNANPLRGTTLVDIAKECLGRAGGFRWGSRLFSKPRCGFLRHW